MITTLDPTTLDPTTVATVAAREWSGPHLGIGLAAFILIPLFWLGVIALVVALVGRRFRTRALASGSGAPWSHGATRGAEQTLAERFAQSDIDEKEYRARLEVLRANRLDPRPPA